MNNVGISVNEVPVTESHPLPVALTGGDPNNPGVVTAPIYTYTHGCTTVATSGDNTLVAAPGAGKRLVVTDGVVQNESTTETTVILKSGSNARWRAKLAANMSLSLGFAAGQEWRLGTNEALVLNLSGANSHGVSLRYRVEDV